MADEWERHLGVDPYERSPERQGHANGYKPKTVTTRVGKISFDVVRRGVCASALMGFYEALVNTSPCVTNRSISSSL